jgi:hypothetical protein
MRLEDVVTENVGEHGCDSERESYNVMGDPLA